MGKTPLDIKKANRYKNRWQKYVTRLGTHFTAALEGSITSIILKKKKTFQKALYDNNLYMNYRWIYTH